MPNIYQPKEAIITDIENLNATTKHFTLRFTSQKDRNNFNFNPGQFILLSIMGFGEIPLGICSSPDQTETFELGVRKAGTVTTELFRKKIGDKVGLRGPYGQGIKLNNLYGKGINLIAGGVGIVPLRSIIQFASWNRKKFGRISLLYGAKNEHELLFKKEFSKWQNILDLYKIVDEKVTNWTGKTGVVTDICSKKTISAENSKIILCGPPVMYKFVIDKLHQLKIEDKNIYLLLERHMKCGIGKCQHCVIGSKYTCQDGPVFRYNEIKEISNAI